jgi:hypothetical protein
MYEFDSVSVSSFEAAELAATLTAKSAEGWDVAAIVTAGSDVVAYLRRSTGTQAKEDDTTPIEVSETAEVVEATPEPAAGEETEPAASASELLATDTSGAADAGGSGWGATDTATSSTGWGTSDSSGSWGGAQQTAAAPVAQPQTPAVPAGWYADPAGRFELRYWDGGAWTEHVSRAGQQYTDPPVA